MTSHETLALVIGLVIIIPICGWLLMHTIRYRLRLQALQDKRVLEERRALPRQRSELWPWPRRDKYQPGEWDGPTRVRERFLYNLYPEWNYQVKVKE